MCPPASASVVIDFGPIEIIPPVSYYYERGNVFYTAVSGASASGTRTGINVTTGSYPCDSGFVPLAYISVGNNGYMFGASADAREYFGLSCSIPAGSYRVVGSVSLRYAYCIYDGGGSQLSPTIVNYWVPNSVSLFYGPNSSSLSSVLGSVVQGVWVIDTTITLSSDVTFLRFSPFFSSEINSGYLPRVGSNGRIGVFCVPYLTFFPVSGGAVSPDYTDQLDAILAELKALESGQSQGLGGIQQILTPSPEQSQYAQDIQGAVESSSQAIESANQAIESAAPRPEPSAAAPPPVTDFVDTSAPEVQEMQSTFSDILSSPVILPVLLLVVALATVKVVLYGGVGS